jgi:hypothetical protein
MAVKFAMESNRKRAASGSAADASCSMKSEITNSYLMSASSPIAYKSFPLVKRVHSAIALATLTRLLADQTITVS